MQDRHSRSGYRSQWIFVALLGFWCFFSAVQLTRSVINSYNRLPETDYWETVPHLSAYRHFPPAFLWEQHYEHRVVFPEMVFALDWLFLKGREILPLFLTGLLNLAVWILFVRLIRNSDAGRTAAAWGCIFLTGIVMFWPGVAFVLAFPFSLQFVMSQFAAAASFWALTRGRLSVAVMLAIVASFSSANGLLVWPLLLAIGWVIPVKRKHILVILAFTVVTIATFFAGYHHLGNAHPEFLRSNGFKVLGYFVAYLGMPLGAAGTSFSLAAGAASLALFAGLLFQAWRGKLIREPAVLVSLALVLQTLALALLTSISRIPIERSFADAIITPGRYVNFGAHYWAALIVLTFVVVHATANRFAWGALAFLAAVIGGAFLNSGSWIHGWMNQYALYQSATLAIESGMVTEPAARTLNFSDGRIVIQSLTELERRHLALYSFADYDNLGKTLENPAAFQELPSANVTSIQQILGGFQLVGWFLSDSGKIFIVDRTGVVVGYGAHLNAGLPIGIDPPAGHEDRSFLAYAGPSFEQPSARFFVRK